MTHRPSDRTPEYTRREGELVRFYRLELAACRDPELAAERTREHARLLDVLQAARAS